MPRGTYLTAFEVGQIVAYHDAGWSQRQIAAQLNRSQNAICHVLSQADHYSNSYQCKVSDSMPINLEKAETKESVAQGHKRLRAKRSKVLVECDANTCKQ